jgi:hypothetical protein
VSEPIVPRSTWQDPAFPITGPPAQLGLISALTAHYPGGNPGDLSSDAKCAAYMRRMQREYVTDRGYSLGYNWMIPPQGGIWEARGILYNNAANGSTSWNLRAFAVQFANGPGEALTDAQLSSARWLHGHLMALCDRQIAWNAHGQVRGQVWPALAPPSQWSTQCPGALIWRQLASGELNYRPLPPPVLPSKPRSVTMLLLDLFLNTPSWTALQCDGKAIWHASNGNTVTVLARGQVPRVEVSEAELIGMLTDVRAKGSCPVPNPSAELLAAWNKSALGQ